MIRDLHVNVFETVGLVCSDTDLRAAYLFSIREQGVRTNPRFHYLRLVEIARGDQFGVVESKVPMNL